jgi:phosphoribosyl 1,2-cyclic phosphate phosphodiesterase
MRVTILGSGTSAGVPTLGCRCAVCNSPDPRNKRMRASIYLEQGRDKILIDCGPDFRTQALLRGVTDVSHLLLTHTHSDHLNGLDDLRSFNMVHGHPISVHATPESLEDVRHRFAYCFQPPPPGGGIPQLDLEPFEPGRIVQIGSTEVLPLRVYHGRLPIVGFRIGKFAYFTDVSTMPDETIAALQGVEVLITSALRHQPHSTHMSLGEAIDLVGRIRPRQAWFTHMSHDLDHDTTNRELPPGIALLYDGMAFEV